MKQLTSVILEFIDQTTDYDVDTVEMDAQGELSAILDADKTFSGPHDMRLALGHIDDIYEHMEIKREQF